MIGWKPRRNTEQADSVDPKGFDDFELRLGDVMRGERATMGKSLLDVQRELRIKATYIAAIENCDPTAFDTPGFIAGYVRSYARYLNMDPDETFDAFCAESGFSTAHGMSPASSSVKKRDAGMAMSRVRDDKDIFLQPKLPFTPGAESVFSRIEPSAIGSSLVLLALIGGIGFGGWSVLQEVQRVQLTPVDQTPVVLSDLDPLQQAAEPGGVTQPATPTEDAVAEAGTGVGPFNPPSAAALDRLYRPQALQVPVVIARDAPISTLDPSAVGVFADSPSLPRIDTNSAVLAALTEGGAAPAPAFAPSGVTLVAVRDAWVRVRDDDQNVIYEANMKAGDTWDVPRDIDAPRLTVGESGALYFAVNGRIHGPAGPRGQVTQDLVLRADELKTAIAEADPSSDRDLDRVLADLGAVPVQVAEPGQPKVLADAAPGITVVAVRPAWVRVRGQDGTTLYEAVMNAGDTYTVPALEQAPTIRVGESGAIYFAVNGQTYGPAGPRGSVTSKLALDVATLTNTYQVADISRDADLGRVVAELNASR